MVGHHRGIGDEGRQAEAEGEAGARGHQVVGIGEGPPANGSLRDLTILIAGLADRMANKTSAGCAIDLEIEMCRLPAAVSRVVAAPPPYPGPLDVLMPPLRPARGSPRAQASWWRAGAGELLAGAASHVLAVVPRAALLKWHCFFFFFESTGIVFLREIA